VPLIRTTAAEPPCNGPGGLGARAAACLLVLSLTSLPALLRAQNSASAESSPATQNEPTRIKLTDRVPFGRPPIDYFSPTTDDAVSRLQQKIDSGQLTLNADGERGYLNAVLQALNVPVSSQLLVFSKTARVPRLVTPRTPRAIFFNDEVAVAWIPESRELELTAIDPAKGANFYTLSQPLRGPDKTGTGRDDSETRPKAAASVRFERRDRCLACHAGRSSLDVPGLLLRAFQTDGDGNPLFGYSQVTHAPAYGRRWGGWYVTGAPSDLIHRGNLVSRNDNEQHKLTPGFRSELTDLSELFEVEDWPTNSSDIVAHLAFAHQMHGLNLLIRVGTEARVGRMSDAEDRLIRYLTFADEPSLPVPIDRAGSEFTAWFEQQSPLDSKGRSLRQCDLQTRFLRHRLSWLVYHAYFQALPKPTRARLLSRLWSGLTESPPPSDFQHLPAEEKSAIVEIVRTTVPELPDCWRP
jgi:hypothetical protein